MARFELAMLLWRTLRGLSPGRTLPSDRPLAEPFADINPAAWSLWNSSTDILRRAGIFEGYPDRQFHGRRTVTRRELETCLRRAVTCYRQGEQEEAPPR